MKTVFSSATTGLVVDIDDTLCDTSRTCMQLMAAKFGTTAAFDVDAFIQTYDQPHAVPDWHHAAGESWLSEHLLSPDFLLSLPPIAAAVQGLQQLCTVVPVTLYLSSRDQRMQAVTEQWLQQVGVPAAQVVTRPTEITDPSWKVKYVGEHFPETLGFIDNEVHLPGEYSYPGKIIEIQPYAQNRHLDPRVTNIHTWPDLETWLRQHLSYQKS